MLHFQLIVVRMNTAMSNVNELTYIYRKHAEGGDGEHLVQHYLSDATSAGVGRLTSYDTTFWSCSHVCRGSWNKYK